MKELTEVLSILNLKINNTKTKISNDIITESIKEDKMYCMQNNITDKKLINKLLIIRNIGKMYPNSGALYKLLVNMYKNEIIKYKFKINSLLQCVSVITDIMYNNPRTYSICIAILSKFLEPLNSTKRLSIIEEIISKFSYLPNTDYLNIWLQRLTIIDNRKKKYNTALCQKLYKNTKIWKSNWINFEIDESLIIDEGKLNSISYVIPKEVVDKFSEDYE